MWCYQKPGFEALLLAELQRQQQCSQFCDALLTAEDVSVPAHSCILSALSPQVSSALSSATAPPAGQSRLLEFRALSACTLLRVVRLLYSGEMAGEGEKERQEAVSAAAKLGIRGLVEVTKRDRESGNEEGGLQHTEVGVQTEPLTPEGNEGRRRKWRREVSDGTTFLWRETLSEVEKDMWTQTEELQMNTAPATHSAASFETIDVAALQGLTQTDSHLVPPQIPYVPISLVYPLEENQAPSSASAASMQDSTAAGHTPVVVVTPPYTSVPPSLLPFSTQTTLCDPQSCWTGPKGAAREIAEGEEWVDEQFAHFQGNIPGFISYFLNADKGEGSHRGRAGRRRAAGVRAARRGGTGERRARRPRARTVGRMRGGLMQTVDVQEVGVSRLQKLFLQRWGMRTSRTGQGGGAAGRTLYLKTRELLTPAKSCRRRRRCGKAWASSQSGEMLPHSDRGGGGGGGNSQCGRRSTTQQFKQIYSIHTLPASGPSLQTSPSPILHPPVASYVSPAPSFLHVTSLPPPAPPPPEDQPEHIDRLLEEVMMGLDILPNNNNSGAPHPQPPLPASSSSCTYASSGSNLAQNKQQSSTTCLLEAGPGLHGFTQVLAVASRASVSENGEAPVLQQGEGELNEMLDHFLRSFEQHVDSCSTRTEKDTGSDSSREASKPVRACPRPVIRSQTTALQQSDKGETRPSRLQPRKASLRRAGPPECAEGTAGDITAPRRRLNKRRKSQYLFSLERKKVRVRTAVSTGDATTKILHDCRDKQLQKMPVVKLERNGPLPVRVTLQGHSCQSLEVKSPAKIQTSSSSVKYACGSLSGKNQPVPRSTKTYPIRSRLKEAQTMDTMPSVKEPRVDKRPPSEGKPAPRQTVPMKNGRLPSLLNGGSSTPPIQLRPAESCGTNVPLQKNQEGQEEKLTVQPQEETEGPTRRRRKRGAESGEETSEDAAVAKRVCSAPAAQPTSETCTPSSESEDLVSEQATTETEDVIDVETVSLTSVGACLKQEEKTAWRKILLGETEECLMEEETEGSSEEIIDVDGDTDPEKLSDDSDIRRTDRRQSRAPPTRSHFVSPPSRSEVSVGSTRSCEDEDVDVIGGSSPVPDPMVISWTECSEAEEVEGDEDVDVVGEKTGCASSATVSKGELNGRYQPEALSH